MSLGCSTVVFPYASQLVLPLLQEASTKTTTVIPSNKVAFNFIFLIFNL